MPLPRVGEKRVLLSRNDLFGFFIVAFFSLGLHVIFWINRNVTANPADWEWFRFFFSAVILLAALDVAVEYRHYHVWADENGIDVYRWNKREHVSWEQVNYCLVQHFPLRAFLMIEDGTQKKALHARWNRRQKEFLTSMFELHGIRHSEMRR